MNKNPRPRTTKIEDGYATKEEVAEIKSLLLDLRCYKTTFNQDVIELNKRIAKLEDQSKQRRTR
jgi:hypothetical protein